MKKSKRKAKAISAKRPAAARAIAVPAGWRPGLTRRAAGFEQPTRPVGKIKVGKRHRKDFGDLKGLAADINEHGLLQPIVVNEHNQLIAGERRLKAWQFSRFRDQPIPVHAVPLADILAGEWAENDPALRKDFKLTEAVAIRKAIEAKLKPEARARLAQAGAVGGRGGGKIEGAKINVAEKASQFTGKSRRTLDKAEAVDDAAKRDPARFGKLKEDMDRTGRADAPYKRLQNMLAADAMRAAPAPMPGNGPYVAGMIDIPWAGEPDDDDPDRRARGYYPYPTMTTAQAVAFMRDKVEPILAPACTIGFWITNYHLEFGHHLPILAALNLKPRAILTGTKDLIGRGQVSRGTTEHMVLASRGDVTILTFPRTDFPFKVDKKNHSRKPQDWFDRFVKHVPASRYFSLFETVKRGKLWDCHGDKMPEAPAAGAAAGDVNPSGGMSLRDLELADQLAVLEAAAAGAIGPGAKGKIIEQLQWQKLLVGTAKKPLRITKAGRDKLHQLREERRHDEELAALPEGIEALQPLYDDALRQLHGAMIDGQSVPAARRMSIVHQAKRLDLIQERAHGGTGYLAPGSQSEKLRTASAAPIGSEPMWGQRGVFTMDVDGVACIVEADDAISISAYACDPDKPFCSETGYLSLAPMTDLAGECEGDDAPLPETIAQFAARLIRDAMAFTEGPSGKRKARKAAPLNPEKCFQLPKSWKGGGSPVEVSGAIARKLLKQSALRSGGAIEADRKDVARALAEDFPNGVEGHAIKQTIDWSGGVPGMSVATCECSESWRASRDLPLSGHDELDKHIVAHWRKVAAEGAQVRPPHAQAAE
jgi:N6-adenosine-specific RNA methylase IME4